MELEREKRYEVVELKYIPLAAEINIDEAIDFLQKAKEKGANSIMILADADYDRNVGASISAGFFRPETDKEFEDRKIADQKFQEWRKKQPYYILKP